MTTQCDGGCLANMKWRFDAKDNSLTTAQTHQAFSIPAFLASYKRVAAAYGLAVTPPAKVPFFCLCNACWAKAAAHWPGGAATYVAIPAKCAADGVYFRTDAPEFADAHAAVDLGVIQSVIIHEMMHYLSHGHTGLQDYESGKNLHWDEATTDFLARETWRGVTKELYKTFYGNISELMATAMANSMNTALKGPKLAGLQSEVAGLPQCFGDALGDLGADKLKKPRADAIQHVVQGWLITWHHEGANVVIPAANNQALAAFVASNWGKHIFMGSINDTKLGYGTLGVFKHP